MYTRLVYRRVKEGMVAQATASTYRKEIETSLNCQSRNILYLIECKKCCLQYVGETDRSLQDRFSDQKGYVNNTRLNQATGEHFNRPGHSISDMSVMAIQKVFDRGAPYRKELGKEKISNFRGFRHGINKNACG